jgi:two-component system phosphate regulon sensor histidine kinase PhoR
MLSFLFVNAARNREKAAMEDKTRIVAGLLNSGEFVYSERLRMYSTRMTIISPDGTTIFDSRAQADLTVNRSDREEFIAAINHGSGQATRQSETFGREAFYVAIRLENGDVLRLSRTLNNLGDVFPAILPNLVIALFVILILAYFMTGRLTKKVIKPILDVNFENLNGSEISDLQYEELWPFVKKIGIQKHKLNEQLAVLKNRADTIDAIIANMHEGLIILDEKGIIMAANQSVMKIFDINREKYIIQKNIQEIHREPDFMQSVKQCLDGSRLKFLLAKKDRVYNVFLNPVMNDDKNHGAIIFFLDTTEQAKLETQRREFSANVSHELKTPLTTISALSEMMANGMANANDIAEFSQKISAHTNRLRNIIDDIIRLSEFDERKVNKDFSTFDITDLANSVLDSLKDKAEEKAVTVKFVGKPLTVTANSRLIDELMYNLVENGIKYNKDGGTVTLRIFKENDEFVISVADTGIGISKEHQARIFERFFRVDSSRSKKTGGTGLGLSIVKHITDHHDGRISVDSTEGEGTTITVTLSSGVAQ